MPTWLLIVLLGLVLLVVVLAVAGELWNRRHRARTSEDLIRRTAEADQALAAAAAADRGWDREALQAAADAGFAAVHGDPDPPGPVLVLVEDRPGTEEDVAVFEATVGGRRRTVTLRRSEQGWNPVP